MSPSEMEQLTGHTDVKAEKIRILFDAGAERAQIAKFLRVSYQHVQNVLKRSGRLNSVAPTPDVAEGLWAVKIHKDGRLTLPAPWLTAQGLREGDSVLCRSDVDGLRIMTRASALGALREAMRRRMPDEISLLEAVVGTSNSV